MSTLAPLLVELDHLLQQEVEAYERLLVLYQEAPNCLAAPALDPLLAHLQAREHLLRHMAQVEHQRAAVTSRLAPLCQLPAYKVTLHALSLLVNDPYASRYRHYCTRLRTLVQDLQPLHASQAELVREVQEFVGTALAFLTPLLPAPPTYRPSGKLPAPTHGRLLSGRV